jgi:hypothetical protein
MSEKKMVRRSVAIALGIICIVLVATVAVLSVVISDKDNTIQTNNGQINSLNSQVSNLNAIINMHVSDVVFDKDVSANAGEDPIVYEFAPNYSGYIGVRMQTDYYRNLTSTWIEVTWSFGIVEYQETRHLGGTIDTEYFPVVGSGGENGGGGVAYVQLGNDRNETITGRMTVTYHY